MYNKNYNIVKNSIKDIFDYLDVFTSKLDEFKTKYSNYNYDITVNKNEDMNNWNAEINIYEKQDNDQEIEKKSRARRVLQ